MPGRIKYDFKETVWQVDSPGGWFFLSLPHDMSKEIRQLLGSQEEGWGRLKATARIGKSEWQTAIWFDGKQDTYLLPVKSEVRQKENLAKGASVSVALWL